MNFSRIQILRIKVLSSGIFSLILTMGIARFAYTPLLPLMHDQAGLGLSEAGLLAAINYSGYLCGAIIATYINDLILKDRLYRMGMIVAVFSTFMMGATDHYMIWALSRFMAGLSSAAGLMLGSGLILNWLIRLDHKNELGIHFSGVGLGIAFCSLVIIMTSPWLKYTEQWYVLSVLGLALLVPILSWLPPPNKSIITKSGTLMLDNLPDQLFLKIFMAAYFCAGFGYVITATFIVAIVNSLPGLAGKGEYVFLVIGIAAAPSCIFWDLVVRRIGELNSLLIAAIIQIFGILLPIIMANTFGVMTSAILFGGTCMGIVSITLTMAGRYFPTNSAKMMGKMTIAYGLAQIIGPGFIAYLASRTHSYSGGLMVAAGFMCVGAMLFYMLGRLNHSQIIL